MKFHVGLITELPPRARRILPQRGVALTQGGTTSACAENTGFTAFTQSGSWNYLRVRGEYPHYGRKTPARLELPPRTRRILFTIDVVAVTIGTTSAHAENTPGGVGWEARPGNYLRARGEYPEQDSIPAHWWELPPRTRRILVLDPTDFKLMGTTSAHAENTSAPPTARNHPRNYLRARGEYTTTDRKGGRSMELPPRTRRIRKCSFRHNGNRGTTSAHAENTPPTPHDPPSQGNYLRARGEYYRHFRTLFHRWELPPRTRRIPSM